jgi:cyclopropane fatty-acyl-phospholipid synthase-like methyltransferase
MVGARGGDLDPRRPHEREGLDTWEDVGALDNLNVAEWMRHLEMFHGVKLAEHPSILEVGSGKGLLFKRLHQKGYDVTAVEPRARSQYEAGTPVATVRLEDLPSELDAAFDLIIASSLFDAQIYQQNHLFMATVISQLLKPGGVFLNGYAWNGGVADIDGLRQLDMRYPFNEGQTVYLKIV